MIADHVQNLMMRTRNVWTKDKQVQEVWYGGMSTPQESHVFYLTRVECCIGQIIELILFAGLCFFFVSFMENIRGVQCVMIVSYHTVIFQFYSFRPCFRQCVCKSLTSI